MSNFTSETSFDNLINSDSGNENVFSPFLADILDGIAYNMNTNPEFSQCLQETLPASENSNESYSVQSPGTISNSQELATVLQGIDVSDDTEINNTRVEIIAQPPYSNRLRYRCDYDKNENRLGVLKNNTKNSNYQGPVVRIPKMYLNNSGEYFVRVTLVTVKYEKTDLHYIHPYELENPVNENMNNRETNSVYFPIQNEDCVTGIKSFPTLRIVKKRLTDFKTYGDLYAFDCQYASSTANSIIHQLSNAKDTINEFNLEESQLAFTIARQYTENNEAKRDLFVDSTVFSHVMIENKGKEIDGEQEIQAVNERLAITPPVCRVYKYAPRYGFDRGEEEMVIFLTNKLEPMKYGELQIRFECNTPNGTWKEVIPKNKIDIKDRMVSFKTPIFTQSIDNVQPIDVFLGQKNRDIGIIKYYYLSTNNPCVRCQFNEHSNSVDSIPNVPNKRPNIFHLNPEFDSLLSNDDIVPLIGSLSLESTESFPSPDSQMETFTEIFNKSIDNIFIKNNFHDFFRLCRRRLREMPNLLHVAIEENHSDLLMKFIPNSLNNILQINNVNGETALLHAIRLNRLEIVQAILDKPKSEILTNDVDNVKNNIFHCIALYSKSLDIFDICIKYVKQNGISIEEKFDRLNTDHFTPLQLSIVKNNLPIVKVYSEYFRRDIYRTEDFTGDNLVHLAVRYGDVEMIKYLIENEDFHQLVNESNLKSTPKQLAQLLERNEIVQYFEEICPESILANTDSSSDEENN